MKEQIDTITEKIDTTTNNTEPYVTAAKTAAKEKVTSILSSVRKKTVSKVKSTTSAIANGEKLSIFSWKK